MWRVQTVKTLQATSRREGRCSCRGSTFAGAGSCGRYVILLQHWVFIYFDACTAMCDILCFSFWYTKYDKSHISSKLLDLFFKESCVFAMVHHVAFWGKFFVTFATIDGELKVMSPLRQQKTNALWCTWWPCPKWWLTCLSYWVYPEFSKLLMGVSRFLHKIALGWNTRDPCFISLKMLIVF